MGPLGKEELHQKKGTKGNTEEENSYYVIMIDPRLAQVLRILEVTRAQSPFFLHENAGLCWAFLKTALFSLPYGVLLLHNTFL